MKNTDRIEHEVHRTLVQMDYPDTLPPDPYFYTRLKARLQNKNKRAKIFQIMLRPVLISLLTLINIGAVIWYNQDNTVPKTDNKKQFVEILISDLRMAATHTSFIFLKEEDGYLEYSQTK